MCIWCRHRVCVGFHIIYNGEGRNDVFSPVYTRWQTAPKVIVYDFACQLYSYNLLRESDFFLNTRHVIDQVHEANHSACSEAYRLSEYKKTGDPNFIHINDSAAEVGNSGLKKLKKSVRYMSLARFMDLCRIQLEVQNRIRIRKLLCVQQ